MMKKVKQIVKQSHRKACGKAVGKAGSKKDPESSNSFGGSGWGSNPPETLLMPHDGFEVREAHRDSTAPTLETNLVYPAALFSATG